MYLFEDLNTQGLHRDNNMYDFFDNPHGYARMFFDDFLNIVPIETYNKEEFLRSSKYFETKDSVKYSLVTFTDFKIKDGSSPIEFEREKIKRIILNQRKIKLVQEMEKLVYEEAVNDGEVEEY